MKEGSCARSNNLIVPTRGSRDARVRPEAGGGKIGAYVEAVNPLLKPYATNADIVKATYEISSIQKMPIEPQVEFVDAVRLKPVRCGNTYPDKQIEEAFVDVLPKAICSKVCTFCGCDLGAHLWEFALYADKLIDRQNGKIEESCES